ncbi:MAG TPA: hypothetical protein VLI05_02960 [Candidatus Saccharimonadia bacterium]|nr:hypothetical protein [Candidatus Saccharimonadia bacterium]
MQELAVKWRWLWRSKVAWRDLPWAKLARVVAQAWWDGPRADSLKAIGEAGCVAVFCSSQRANQGMAQYMTQADPDILQALTWYVSPEVLWLFSHYGSVEDTVPLLESPSPGTHEGTAWVTERMREQDEVIVAVVAAPCHLPRIRACFETLGVRVVVPRGLRSIGWSDYPLHWLKWRLREIVVVLAYARQGYIR